MLKIMNELTGSVTGTIDGQITGTLSGDYANSVSGSITTNQIGELKVYTDEGEPLYFNVLVKID